MKRYAQPDLWGTFKTVLRWKFIILHVYIKVSERAQIHIATQEFGKAGTN